MIESYRKFVRASAAVVIAGAVSTVGMATLTAGAAPAVPKGTCIESRCNVYASVPWHALKGKKVGILNLAPVPGATRWSFRLQNCLKAHGATVNYVDVGGDVTKAPAQLQTWLNSGVKAIFDIGVDISGQAALVNQAGTRHIPVITWGAGANLNDTNSVALDANQYRDGVILAQHLVSKLGTNFSVGEISASINPALQSRYNGLKSVFKNYPNITQYYTEDDSFTANSAYTAAQAILQAHPSVNAFIGMFGDYGLGATQAVKAASGSHAIVASMNGDPGEYNALRSGGPFKMTVADGHEQGGQLACETAAVMLNGGKPVGHHIYLSSSFTDSTNLPKATVNVNNSPRSLNILTK